MAISVTCPQCQQRLKAKEELAGRTVACPKCRAPIAIPSLAGEDVAAYLLAEEPQAGPPSRSKSRAQPVEAPVQPAAPIKKREAAPAVVQPISMKEPPPWLRHLHWGLIVALIPLAFSLLLEQEPLETVQFRLFRTIDKAGPDIQARADSILDGLDKGRGSLELLFDLLPDSRIEGAHLPRRSQWHWLYAFLSTIVFLGFILVLASYEADQSLRLLWIGLFTATVGILFLLILQAIANWAQMVHVRGGGIFGIVLLIAKFIGFSYHAAADPENGFLLSFLGYTAGVGLCEELCKAAPLFFLIRTNHKRGWRTFFLWGLASGAGFGICEGIIYSANTYNGIHSAEAYFVRFISCVALHALWTGSVGITLEQNQHLLETPETWYEFFPPLIRIVLVPMVLHGLYDTLLKKEMPGYALLAAIASFLFLAFQISQLHSVDDERENKAMLRRYKKQRQATS